MTHVKYKCCSLIKTSISFTKQNKKRRLKHWISNIFVVRGFCEQKRSFKITRGKFCELGFNETYNYDIMESGYKVLLLYELTLNEVLLLYKFTFLTMLHIKCNVG